MLDATTQLEWKKMYTSDRKLMDNNLTTNFCQDPWRFPNINELRTLIDPATGKVDALLMPEYDSRADNIWSTTKFVDTNISIERNFIIKATSVPFIVNVDIVDGNNKNYTTCVREK